MENLPFRSVYRIDFLGGQFGRYMDSLLPSQFNNTELKRKRSYEGNIRLLQEREYRWLREVMTPKYEPNMTLSPLSSDAMVNLRYQQREYLRRLAQPRVVKPRLFSASDNARMENFNIMCEKHRNVYNDYDKYHAKYAYFEQNESCMDLSKDYFRKMFQDTSL